MRDSIEPVRHDRNTINKMSDLIRIQYLAILLPQSGGKRNIPTVKMHLSRGLWICFLLFYLGGCATLPDNSDMKITTAYNNTEDTSIGRQIQVASQNRGKGQSGFMLLNNGLDAFVARAVLAHKAERSIDAQYHLC